MTRTEIITTLCELVADGEELKQRQEEHNAKLQRLLEEMRSGEEGCNVAT